MVRRNLPVSRDLQEAGPLTPFDAAAGHFSVPISFHTSCSYQEAVLAPRQWIGTLLGDPLARSGEEQLVNACILSSPLTFPRLSGWKCMHVLRYDQRVILIGWSRASMQRRLEEHA
jgi:hypothetical protein